MSTLIEDLKKLHRPYPIWRVINYRWESDREVCQYCGRRVEDSFGVGCIHHYSDEGDIICALDGPEYVVCEHCFDLGDSDSEYPCETMELVLKELETRE